MAKTSRTSTKPRPFSRRVLDDMIQSLCRCHGDYVRCSSRTAWISSRADALIALHLRLAQTGLPLAIIALQLHLGLFGCAGAKSRHLAVDSVTGASSVDPLQSL
jgi:hypothetical protein